MARRSTAVVLQ